ncbi:MAG: phage holin family protein [Chloroflexota bacterium]|nr:MAG: phage holin family protein [Chloroflexota bacterium]
MAREVHHEKEERTATGQENQSLGELFSELTKETTTLVRQEIQLAKTEISQKATSAGKDVGFLAAGGLAAYGGFLALIAAAILLIGHAITMWVSALIVGVVVVGIGGFLVMSGLNNLKNQQIAPHETLETLKEDKQWATEQTR